jgi:hypothetical protein
MREDLESQGVYGGMKNDWRMSQSLENFFVKRPQTALNERPVNSFPWEKPLTGSPVKP